MNKKSEKVRLCSSFGSSRTVNLSGIFHCGVQNFIPLVHDSIIIIGSRSITYTFGSRFAYKRWVRVLSKIWILAFLGKYSNIVCWVSMRVDWGPHQRDYLQMKRSEDQSNSQPFCFSSLKTLGLGILAKFWQSFSNI